ncbi:MAG: class I adenylate-forming enzyme family protein [Pseudorhodoplanes sp.]
MNLAQYVFEAGSAYGADRIAVICSGREWSYRHLFDEIEKFAIALVKLGVRRGDRIMAHMPNRAEYFIAYLGAAKVGAICATVNIDYTTAEVAHMIRHAEPKCIVTDDVGAEKIEATVAATGLKAPPVVRIDDGAPKGHHYRKIAAGLPPVGFVDVADRDGVLLCYTSGTSGMPKPVLTTHAGEIWAARSFSSMWRLNWADKVVVALPLAWVYGLGTVSVPALSVGATVVLLPRFRPDLVCDAIVRTRGTVFAGVTTMYRMIVEYAFEQNPRPDLHSLRLAMAGGERRNEAAFDRFEQLSGIPVHDLYASSEARPILGYDPLTATRPVPGAAGILFPGVEAELRDDDGKIVAPGEIGELFVRSPNTFREYYREPELTADRVDKDGWVKTGDLFRIDENGYWHIQGRKQSDMINRSGAKVSPAEVEAHLVKHPMIKEAVVVARSDPRYGEEVVACIVGTLPEADAARLVKEHCKDVLADYKVPTSVILLTDMPYGTTGKIDRRALGDMANARAIG